MATTSYGVNAPESVKLWRKRLAREALKATYVGKFIGDSDDSLVQVFPETSKGAGDSVRVTLRMQLTGDGVLGDGTLEGNEEALTTYTDNLLVDQLRHAVRSAGKMTQQRIPWSIREEAMSGLRDWWAGRLDYSFFNQLCGFTAQTDVRYTGNQATLAPTTVIRANAQATDQAVGGDATAIMTLGYIDQAVALAKTQTPVIRPITIAGEDHYVLFLHPFQVQSIRTNTASGQWLDIQKAATTGDGSAKNPIFTGALGVYNGVVLHEAVRVTRGVNSSTGAAVPLTRRAVLCGAQSAAIGFGQDYSFEKFDWNEELFDYGNQLGVEAGCIYGLKKLRFNGLDFSTIVITTYSNAADTVAYSQY
jgi:N4-gp56 family major capsid protein